MTKRCVFLSIMMMFEGLAAAQIQTQQGYTKTIGKPDKPGVALAGVEVRIDGNTNTVLSNEKGNFSFPVNSKQFKLSRAKKNGYELADPDLLRQSYGFTYNTPFVIPFISTEELRRIKNAIEDSTRQKLGKKFAEQNALLVSLKDRNKLSEEEFGKQLTELETKYNNLDTLVQKLADRYARTDYDNIDSTRLLINQAIEQGDVERAIQLIKSKGDIADRLKKIEEKENRGKVLTQMGDQQLQEAQAEKDELAADLKQLAEYHYDQHYYDSAYFCMEQRYLLDTMSVVYLYDLVLKYSFPYNDFKEEEKLERVNTQKGYLSKLRQHTSELSTILGQDSMLISGRIISRHAELYSDIGQRQMAIDQYRKSFSVLQHTKLPIAVTSLTEICRILWNEKSYHDARIILMEALSYLHEVNNYDASTLFYLYNLYELTALMFLKQENIKQAMHTYQMAEQEINTFLKQYDGKSQHEDIIDKSLDYLIPLQGLMALYLADEGESKKSIGYYDKAISNAIQKYERSKINRDIFPIIALYKQQYDVYNQQKDYKKMLQCAEGAVDYAKQYMQRMPSSKSRLLYAESLSLLADVHACQGETDLAKEELIECLKKAEIVYNVYGDRYLKLCSNIYASFATCYARQKQYTQALYAIDKSISCSAAMPKAYQRKLDILRKMERKEEVAELEKFYATLLLQTRKQITTLDSYKFQYFNND